MCPRVRRAHLVHLFRGVCVPVFQKPSDLVKELDRFIIGQSDAKKAVAIALRNRWRRHRLPAELRSDVTPKNLLLIGPTGSGQDRRCDQSTVLRRHHDTHAHVGAVPSGLRLCVLFFLSSPGKTEIARRLARLTHSPFIKVSQAIDREAGHEWCPDSPGCSRMSLLSLSPSLFAPTASLQVEATKYTEVGFHGRDVDSIIQDLVRAAISSAKARRKAEARVQVQRAVSDKLLAALTSADASSESFREALEAGQLEAIEVEVEVPVRPIEEDDESGGARSPTAAKMGRMFGDLMRAQRGGGKTELRKLSIADARPLLEEAEMDALVAPEEVTREALEAVQNDGIVFIDEIDKVASSGTRHSADASAEGVQRDLLPLLEGTTVTTKQGDINTDHILFICSGAFHTAKPSDLLAELQGRLPIRVELVALTEDDLYRVLSQTDNSLVAQQTALMAVDQVKLVWKDEALREIAKGQAKASGGRQNSAARGGGWVHLCAVALLSFFCSRASSLSLPLVSPSASLRRDEPQRGEHRRSSSEHGDRAHRGRAELLRRGRCARNGICRRRAVRASESRRPAQDHRPREIHTVRRDGGNLFRNHPASPPAIASLPTLSPLHFAHARSRIGSTVYSPLHTRVFNASSTCQFSDR